MSVCPGCGRCRQCGQPAPVVYPWYGPYPIQPAPLPVTYPGPIWVSPGFNTSGTFTSGSQVFL